MAAVPLLLVLLYTVLTHASPIETQVEILQHQVLTLSDVLDNVVKEFSNLRQRHEDLETKFDGLSIELSSVRKQQGMVNIRKERNLVKPQEDLSGSSKRQSWNSTVLTPTFILQDHWKGQGLGTVNAGTKGDKGEAGLQGPKGDAGLQGATGVAGLQGAKGVAGLQGSKGDAGQRGPQGSTGHSGQQGLPGYKGQKGDAGQRGPQGSTGHSGQQGLLGYKGQKGHSGSKGEPGVNGVQQKIAFHVQLRNDLGSLTANEIIIMRSSLVQLGTGYDENRGIFTCPVAGLYVFSVTIVVGRGGKVEVELFKNGAGILHIYAAGNMNKDGSGSNLGLVELQVNDRVWVQVHDIYFDQAEIIFNPFTTFSGFLLFPQ